MITPIALPEDAEAALEPVRTALRARAEADAAAMLAAADADAKAALATASEEAGSVHARAHAEGERDAEAVRAAERARAGRRARTIVLRARRDAYDQLRRRARAAVRGLREDPGYPALRERLRVLAIDRLGAGAEIHDHPDGGLTATNDGRRIDLRLDALADHALDQLGGAAEALWAP